jgi:hypothetical protein
MPDYVQIAPNLRLVYHDDNTVAFTDDSWERVKPETEMFLIAAYQLGFQRAEASYPSPVIG